MLRFGKGFIIGVGVALFIASAANAKTYRFRVNCADETYVAQWEADSPDLDKDYFRVATGDEILTVRSMIMMQERTEICVNAGAAAPAV
jgi:hypothetical protein